MKDSEQAQLMTDESTINYLRHALQQSGRLSHAPADLAVKATQIGRRRRRRRRAALLAPVSAVVICAGGMTWNQWVSGSIHTVPSSGEQNSSASAAEDAPRLPGEKYMQPPLSQFSGEGSDLPGQNESLDLPGYDFVNWRGQIQASLRDFPGTFVVPKVLPDDISIAFTSEWSGRPVLDVMQQGAGVLVCVGDLDSCKVTLGDSLVNVVRSGVVNGLPFQVLLKPPSRPDASGELSSQQKQYWMTVEFTDPNASLGTKNLTVSFYYGNRSRKVDPTAK